MSHRYYEIAMPPKPPAPSDVADKFMLRLPDGMRDRVAALAKVNGRSMNAEIVQRLQHSIEVDETGLGLTEGEPALDFFARFTPDEILSVIKTLEILRDVAARKKTG